MKTTFYIRRNIAWGPMLEVHVLVSDAATNYRAYWEPVTVREVKNPEEVACEPPSAFPMTPQDAQQLMDELWHVGLRPSEGTGSAGAMAATQAHLKDMQTAHHDMRALAMRVVERWRCGW